MPFPNFANKKILILGLGLLGRGVNDALFFARQGAEVTVTDLKTAAQLKKSITKLKRYPNVKLVLGRHDFKDIDRADLIIRNAGVPLKSEFVQYALKNKKNIDMDESLFAKYCPCPIIGITGTRGKTTTAVLTAAVLELTGRRVYLAGNIMGAATLPLITKVKADDLVVLELSSWQLQGFGWAKISPHIAIFTNLYPDHLNSYANMAEYLADKKLIYRYQQPTDYLIINSDNPTTSELAEKINHSQVIKYSARDLPKSWQLKIPGEHNRANAAAALQTARLFNISDARAKKVIVNFEGVPHRLQTLRTLHGVTFINDTTSTTPVAAQTALASIKQPLILIAGGASKNLDLTDFAKDIARLAKVRAVVLLDGTATDDLEKLIIKFIGQKKIAGRFNQLKPAVLLAQQLAKPGRAVLLSPGCASFGMFINEFDRGDQFTQITAKLK